MPKANQTPGEALQQFINEYQTNALALSKTLGVAYQTVTFIIKGKSRISAQMAVRLSKHFNNTPEYWLYKQAQSEIAELIADKKFTAQLNKIPKAQKPLGKTTSKATKKTAKPKKVNKLSTAKPIKQAAKSRKKVKAFKTGSKAKK